MTRTRRSVLGAVGGALLLAGCVEDDDDGTDDQTDDTDATDDEEADPGYGTGDSDDTADDDYDDDDHEDNDDPNDDDDDYEDDEDDATDDDDHDEEETLAVQVHTHEEYGDILVGPDGLTLYMFDSDEQGAGESTCYDGCAESWPPLTVEDGPTAGEDVTGELSTFERADDTTQVAVNGWPLYYWVADEAEGDVDGQGVNDVWWVLTPDGKPVREDDEEDEDGDGDDDDSDDDYDDDDDDGPGY